MKKLNYLFLFLVLLFIGCASSPAGEKDFIVNYDPVLDSTTITHPDMQLKYFYNVMEGLGGERENLRLYIYNKSLTLAADYQYHDWLFIDEVILFSDSGERLRYTGGYRTSKVISGDVIRERYGLFLSEEKARELLAFLENNENIYCSFVGANYHTEEKPIKENVRGPMIATINKYLEK